MSRARSYQNQITDDRPGLAQDREFLRFLQERMADEQREADRLQNEIETLLAQADVKRREQDERLNIVAACAAGIAINDKAQRPAPTLAPHAGLGDLPTVSGADPLGTREQGEQS